jgi:Skp family chaperone for outer membrane proteins
MRVALPLLALAALALLCTGVSADEAKPQAPRIAVVHLDEVIRNSKLYITRIEVLKKEKGEAEGQVKLMDEQLQQLDTSLSGLSQSNERFAKISEEFEMLKVKRKLTMDRLRADIDRRNAALIKSCFETIHDLLAKYSKENGILLVHLVPNAEIQTSNTAEIQLQLGMESLLYADPALDITKPFIEYVNSRYTADAPAPGAPAPAAPLGPFTPPAAGPAAGK